MAKWTNDTGACLTAGGKSLEYRCWGPAPGKVPTIVLLHEGLGSVGLWKDFPQKLVDATGLGVLAYTRAGYGASDPVDLPRPLDYQTREATDVLPDVLNAFDFDRCLLMGHSDGATIAAIYAGSVSDMRVRGLILMAPHFFTEPMGIASIAAVGRDYDTGLRDRLARHHAHVDVAFKGWHDTWTDPGFEGWNVADVIDHWRIPVLAIQGKEDCYGTLAQIEEIESRIYAPLETALLNGCGHDPHKECPKETLAAVSAFSARLERLEQVEVRLG